MGMHWQNRLGLTCLLNRDKSLSPQLKARLQRKRALCLQIIKICYYMGYNSFEEVLSMLHEFDMIQDSTLPILKEIYLKHGKPRKYPKNHQVINVNEIWTDCF